MRDRKGVTFSIQCFGCRVNQAEAFEWAEALQILGFKLEKNYFRSHLVIVNSCALTAGAEREVRKFLRRLARLNPQARLVITGCAVPLLKAEIEKHPQISLVISNEEKDWLLPRLLQRELNAPPQSGEKNYKKKECSMEKEREEWFLNNGVIENSEAKYFHFQNNEEIILPDECKAQVKPFRLRALIKVQDGCSHTCTFCIIPQLRGPGKSLPAPLILQRMRHLTSLGYKEIVLSGIHLTSYGQDNSARTSLIELLRQATEIPDLGRIRLSSLDPRSLEDDLIDFIAGHEKICQHFHLSLQHASPRVLSLMGRGGGPENYLRILNRLREKSPFASLGADIIVGFPGETEEDYLFLEDFILNSPLTYLHVFPYSPRPGTIASSWPQLDNRVKRERAEKLRSIARQKNFDFRQSLLGLTLEGIALGEKKMSESEVLTHNYLKVRVKEKLREGEEVAVRIEEVRSELTRGSVISPWGR